MIKKIESREITSNEMFVWIIVLTLIVEMDILNNEEDALYLISMFLTIITYIWSEDSVVSDAINQINDLIYYYEKWKYLKIKLLSKMKIYLKLWKKKNFLKNYMYNWIKLILKEKKNLDIKSRKIYARNKYLKKLIYLMDQK